MYAVIETGGKQHIVELGTELEVELLDVEPGQEINLERVLFVGDGAESPSIGRPLVADAVVSAVVLRQDRGPKTISFKYRPKARRRVKKGHRQELTVLRITDVRLGDRSAAAEAEKAQEKAAGDRERIAEAAARQAAEDQALAAKLAARTKKAAEEAEAAEGTAGPAEADAKPKRARSRAKAAETAETAETAEAAETPETAAGESSPEDETGAEGGATKRARTKKDE